jgi:hypothetical protein
MHLPFYLLSSPPRISPSLVGRGPDSHFLTENFFVYLLMMVIKISWLFGNRNQITAAEESKQRRTGEEESSMAMVGPKCLC